MPTSTSTLTVIRFGGESYAQTNLPRYGYVIGGVGKVADLPYTKSRNASAKVLQWCDALSIINNDNSNPSSVDAVTAMTKAECQASETLPGDPWVLYDSGGTIISYNSYPTENFSNPGSANYRNRCNAALLARIDGTTGDGGYAYDGFVIDNIFPSWYRTDGSLRAHASAAPVLYPVGSGADKDANWRPAIVALVQYTLGPLHDLGYYIGINATHPDETGSQGWTKSTTWWTSVASYVDCINIEYCMQPAGGSFAGEAAYNGMGGVNEYDNRLGFHQTLNGLGLDMFAGAHWEILKFNGAVANTGTTAQKLANLARANMYFRAAFLLEWNGTSGGGYRMQQTGTLDPADSGGGSNHYDAWMAEIGTPTGAKTAPTSGVWRRDYTQGTVIVNPRAYGGANYTFDLGATYIDSSGAAVTQVTLAPVNAMILTLAAAPTDRHHRRRREIYRFARG